MANWHGRGNYPDSDDEEGMQKLNKKHAENRTKAERREALNKAHKKYENTKIEYSTDINKIRTAARALIAALKPYAANSSNASTIKAIHEYIRDDLNRNFLKNLKSNAKGLAAAEATKKKHNNNLNYAMYTS
jgi:lysozyme family protein